VFQVGLAREQEPKECVVCGAPADALWQRVKDEDTGEVARCCCEGHAQVWIANQATARAEALADER
jgi:hypothetical protein